MRGAFRKLSRVRGLFGATTTWYLSEDCLLAAKRVMYTVEYRRFYLRDLESMVVWPRLLWLLPHFILGALLASLGALFFWTSVKSPTGDGFVFTVMALIFAGAGLALLLWALAFGPPAEARIRTTGVTVDLPFASRARRARRLLAKIDAAVRAARGGMVERPAASAPAPQPAAPAIQTGSGAASAAAPIGNLT